MWKNTSKLRTTSLAREAHNGPFLRLDELLAHYGRAAPERNAIAAPGRTPMNYGILLGEDAARESRSLGPRDRVAVVLPGGLETAVALVGIASPPGKVQMIPETQAVQSYDQTDITRSPQTAAQEEMSGIDDRVSIMESRRCL